MLILASASPRRRDLLTQAGVAFTCEAADVPEQPRPDEAAAAYVSRLAEEKSDTIWQRHAGAGDGTAEDPLMVLGADTCVLGPHGEIFGKPTDRDDARRMLELLAGRTHQVLTGLNVRSRSGSFTEVEVTQVTFDLIEAEELNHYLESGEPLDKAGGYGIQGYAARWIPRIEGCFFNVMGLPIARTLALLRKARAGSGPGGADPTPSADASDQPASLLGALLSPGAARDA